jgi:murein DD-endopeptidase MepM/ murein hydrolase activator NlpD
MRDGANTRSGPGTTFAKLIRATRGATFTVTEARREASGEYMWARGNLDGSDIWMREDLLALDGDLEHFGLGFNDSYPAPMASRWWVRGFTGGGPGEHWGWDFGAATGEPILAGPKGGTVVVSLECTKCAGGRSFKDYGIPLSDGGALSDPAWNFGYGHYVIVRYMNADLPKSTQDALAARGLAGAHLFAMYAHLDQRRAEVGQTVGPNTVIGTCGDTGNSEATHLHLEVRAGRNPNDSWAAMKSNLLDPGILFRR